MNFGEMFSVVGQLSTEAVLLSKFFYLCEDGVWGVRNACAECFAQVSSICSARTRREDLAQLFISLICDQSRWVRMAAFQSLGSFIATFADPNVTGLHMTEDSHIVIKNSEQEQSKNLIVDNQNSDGGDVFTRSKGDSKTQPGARPSQSDSVFVIPTECPSGRLPCFARQHGVVPSAEATSKDSCLITESLAVVPSVSASHDVSVCGRDAASGVTSSDVTCSVGGLQVSAPSSSSAESSSYSRTASGGESLEDDYSSFNFWRVPLHTVTVLDSGSTELMTTDIVAVPAEDQIMTEDSKDSSSDVTLDSHEDAQPAVMTSDEPTALSSDKQMLEVDVEAQAVQFTTDPS